MNLTGFGRPSKKVSRVPKSIIYTKPGCPYCAAAMQDMRQRGVPFIEKDAQGDPAARAEMVKLSGGATVPVIIAPDGQVTVGFGGG